MIRAQALARNWRLGNEFGLAEAYFRDPRSNPATAVPFISWNERTLRSGAR